MKHYLSYLRGFRQELLKGSSYSTVRACVAALVFMLLAINCGPPPQGPYHVPETALAAAERKTSQTSGGSQVSLPDSATVQLQKLPYIRNAFKEPPRVGSRGGLDDFYATTRSSVQNLAIISNCSLDVLKAFIAKGWPPIVMIQFQGRSPEIVILSDYNDQLSEMSLQNPTSLNKRRLSYTDFEASWSKSSRNKCALITPQQLSEMDVQNVLGRYLPTEAFQGIGVRSR
ncbi:MAG: hypothetical protein OXI61_06275 [Candidatus Poribacteria bacterium]|nr:hypothetical protein [Candidatus Poribacteria bacterium]